MRKNDYIQLLITDNITNDKNKKLYDDVIDCVDIALSQTSNDFDIVASISLKDLFEVIEEAGRKSPSHCVGPFEAAELIAKRLGTKYVRSSRKTINDIVNLEDFL